MRPAPMTAAEAADIVATMRRETSKPARVRMMRLGLKLGDLSDAAKDVYRAALAQDGAES